VRDNLLKPVNSNPAGPDQVFLIKGLIKCFCLWSTGGTGSVSHQSRHQCCMTRNCTGLQDGASTRWHLRHGQSHMHGENLSMLISQASLACGGSQSMMVASHGLLTHSLACSMVGFSPEQRARSIFLLTIMDLSLILWLHAALGHEGIIRHSSDFTLRALHR
jgi:hypothetical protein